METQESIFLPLRESIRVQRNAMHFIATSVAWVCSWNPILFSGAFDNKRVPKLLPMNIDVSVSVSMTAVLFANLR